MIMHRHASISQTQPLDVTLSTCTQLLWSTMARPVLSGTGPVKQLQGWTYPLGKGRRLPPKAKGPLKCFSFLRYALSADTRMFITRQPSACPSWTCFLCILLVAKENIMHLKLTAVRARGLSFPARAHLSFSLSLSLRLLCSAHAHTSLH